MRTKIYNAVSGAISLICGIYLGVICGYKNLDLCGLFLTIIGKSGAIQYVFSVLLYLLAIAGYIGMTVRGLSKIKSLYKPNDENKVTWAFIDVISLIFIVAAHSYFINDLQIVLILYIVSIAALVCEIIILIVNIKKEKIQIFNENNCMNITGRITRTVVAVIIIGLVILFKGFIIANAEQMAQFQSLSGGFDSFSMSDFEGNEYTEDMFKGHKVTMINIWATTCYGCIMEMPDLQEISEMYDEKDFQIIGMLGDLRDYNSGEVDNEQVDIAKNSIDMTGVKYPNLIPSMEIQMGVLRNVTAYPTTIFFDENGNQLEVIEGSRPKDMWIDLIEEVLESEK